MSALPVITAFDWVPDGARGLVRDLRARWALEEVGQPYDVRLLRFGEQQGAEHRAIQPFGQVPTYEDGEIVLFESGAIVLHIAQQHPGLLPDDPAGRSTAICWLFAALNTVEGPIWDRFATVVMEGAKPWSQARLPMVMMRLGVRLDDLSDRLGDGDWLDGAFSAGDLMMVSVLRVLNGTDVLDDYPRLAAYVARGEARPAFRRALDAQLADFTGQPTAAFAAMLAKYQDA